MPKARLPENEAERIRTLASFEILDTLPEDVYDDLTQLAARLCKTPIALLSLVDPNRQWFKSKVGITAEETPRDWAFCAHAILDNKPFIISNATSDPRTMDSPLVTGDPHLRYYAGIPLITNEGHALGTLCVLDTKPRETSETQLDDLRLLARQIMSQLELRRLNKQANEQNRELENARQKLAQIAAELPGVVFQFLLRPDGTSCFPYASEGIRKIYRVTPDDVRTDATKVFDVLHPDDYESIVESMLESERSLLPWQKEYRVCFPGGDTQWLFGQATPMRLADRSVVWHGFVTDVTIQRQQREEVHRLRSHLQAIVDSSTQTAIIATDINGCISVFNTGAERMLGYSENEMLGQTTQSFHLESEIKTRSQQLSLETGRAISGFDVFIEYARQGRHDAREWTYVRKDGSSLIVNLVITSIRDGKNNLTGFLGMAIDVTAAREVAQELRDERQRLHLAMNGGKLGTWDWNTQSGEWRIDDRYANILGEPTKDILSNISAWRSRVHSEDIQGVWRKVQEHLAGRLPHYEAKFRMRHADQSWRTVVARGELMERDLQGRPLRMLGTIIDVTAHEAAEDALRETESRFQALAAFAPVGIYQTDEKGSCIFTNERWQTIAGLSLQESLGNGWVRCIHPKDLEFVSSNWQSFVAGSGSFELEFRIVRPDGGIRHVQSKARRVITPDGDSIGFVGINEDVTDRKEVELALIAAREKAESANHSKSSFLANMSHEIRTPLTTILGHTDLLRDYGISSSERDLSLNTIKRSGDHLLSILNDILDLSKIESGKLSIETVIVEPTRLVSEVLDYFREIAKARDVLLIMSSSGTVPDQIQSDPVRLRQILVNLVGNAVKFTAKGSIEVVMQFNPPEENRLPQMVFQVSDTGIGISSEQSAILFSPFVQADGSTTRQFGGTGLGLTISRRLARLLGGDVVFTSIPKVGSTFTARVQVTLPNEQENEKHAKNQAALKPAIEGTTVQLKGRILLAEDSLDIQRLVKAFLTKAGASVDVADNGRIAVDLWTANFDAVESPKYDMVIMDMQMPEMDGCEAAIEMRRLGFAGPMVALTANAMPEDREKCYASGFNDFASKPIDRAALISLCHEAMTRKTQPPISPVPAVPFDSSQISRVNTKLFEVLRSLSATV